MAPLLILLVGYQATAGLFTGNTAMILRAGGMALLALPLLLGLVTVVMLFASAFDQGTQFILSASGESQNMAGFMKLFGFELNDSGEFQQMNSEYNVWRGVAENSSGFELLIPMVLSFVIWLASLFLGFMMALRTTALVMLTAMAAVAVFALSSDATKAWFFRWLSMVFGLLIAKPLSAAALVMAISVFRYSATTAQLLAALAAVIIAAIMPVAMMALFSFSAVQASGGLEAAMSRSSGSLMRNSGRGAGAMTRLIRR
ncbi:type IV secretion system protein [Kocuria sp. ZOR0020]|nr:type IV secretion system protein [Kocuria sp. ZOR0020]